MRRPIASLGSASALGAGVAVVVDAEDSGAEVAGVVAGVVAFAADVEFSNFLIIVLSGSFEPHPI